MRKYVSFHHVSSGVKGRNEVARERERDREVRGRGDFEEEGSREGRKRKKRVDAERNRI